MSGNTKKVQFHGNPGKGWECAEGGSNQWHSSFNRLGVFNELCWELETWQGSQQTKLLHPVSRFWQGRWYWMNEWKDMKEISRLMPESFWGNKGNFKMRMLRKLTSEEWESTRKKSRQSEDSKTVQSLARPRNWKEASVAKVGWAQGTAVSSALDSGGLVRMGWQCNGKLLQFLRKGETQPGCSV